MYAVEPYDKYWKERLRQKCFGENIAIASHHSAFAQLWDLSKPEMRRRWLSMGGLSVSLLCSHRAFGYRRHFVGTFFFQAVGCTLGPIPQMASSFRSTTENDDCPSNSSRLVPCTGVHQGTKLATLSRRDRSESDIQ